jgi:hypothetical protein
MDRCGVRSGTPRLIVGGMTDDPNAPTIVATPPSPPTSVRATPQTPDEQYLRRDQERTHAQLHLQSWHLGHLISTETR